MKNHIILGLLGVAVVVGLSTQVLSKKAEPQLGEELNQSTTKNATMMLDPETGEVMNDLAKIEELRAAMKNNSDKEAKDDVVKQEIVMTEMDDGTLKLSLGKRYLRPQSVSVDDDGKLINQADDELENTESE